MNKLNFNQLSNIKTPENWIENAINIPNKKKKIIYLKSTAFVAAASLVVCVSLSFMIFTMIGNDNQVPFKSTNTTSTPHTSVSDVVETVSSSYPLVTVATNSTEPTEITQIIEKTEATQNATSVLPQTQVVTEPTEATKNIIPLPSTNPTLSSTQLSTEVQTTTIPMILQPSEVTLPPTALPTFSENPSTDSVDYFIASIYFYANENTAFDRSKTLYCHLERADGKTFSNKYSFSEMVTQKQDYNDSYTAIYTPKKSLNNVTYGEYIVTFYNKNGASVTQRFYFGDNDIKFYE